MIARQVQAVFRILQTPLQPVAGLQVVDMHELDTDRPAVALLKPLEHLAQGLRIRAAQRPSGDWRIKFRRRETMILRIEFQRSWPAASQRINPGRDVATSPIVPDQEINSLLQAGQPQVVPRGRPADSGVCALPAHGPELCRSTGRCPLDRRLLRKVAAPLAGYAVGIFQEFLIERFHVPQAQGTLIVVHRPACFPNFVPRKAACLRTPGGGVPKVTPDRRVMPSMIPRISLRAAFADCEVTEKPVRQRAGLRARHEPPAAGFSAPRHSAGVVPLRSVWRCEPPIHHPRRASRGSSGLPNRTDWPQTGNAVRPAFAATVRGHARIRADVLSWLFSLLR